MTARLQPSMLLPALVLGLLCAAVGVLAGIDPPMGVVAALCIALLVLTFADLTAGLVILVVVVFAESTPLAGPALSFTKIVGLVLVLGWLARLATKPGAAKETIVGSHPAFTYVLIAFLAWTAISMSWAPNVGDAFTATSGLLLVVILYAIVYTAVRTPRQAAWVIGGLVAGAAGTTAYGLVVRPANEGANQERLVSTVQDPNVLAAILVVGFALGGAAFVASRGWPALRLGAGAASALCLLGFFLTGSRGGLVAFSVALAAAIVVGGRWRGRAFAATLVVVTGTFAYYALYAPDSVRDRVGSAVQGESAGANLEQQESRLTIWTVAWRMAEDNPVAGVGAGNFKNESTRYVLESGSLYRTDRVIDNPAEAHNAYLQVLVELGIVGAVLFLGVIAFSLLCGFRATRTLAAQERWRTEVLARGVLVATAGVLAAALFISWQDGKVFWLLLALGPAMLAVAHGDREPPDGAGGSANGSAAPPRPLAHSLS